MIIIKTIILFLVATFLLGSGDMLIADESKLPENNNVLIAPNAIGIALGRILLIRKGNDYGVVKFTQCWMEKTKYDQYAEYEAYYQGDKTGDLNNRNVKYRKEKVYYTKPSFSIFGHPVRIGAKRNIRCGPVELWWSGLNCTTAVYFNKHDQPQGDYGIELAPTKWTDISQVNVFDQRLKWYRYDENRKDSNIPVDKLWE